MSIAAVGSLGHTSSKTSGQTLSLSPSRAVPVGSLVVVWAALMPVDGNFTDGVVIRDQNYECRDSEGNIYTTLVCGYSAGFFAISEALFITYVDTALTTSSTITITARETTITGRAMSVEEFTIDPGKRWCVYRDKTVGFENHNTGPSPLSQPSTLTISGLPNEEHLFLHCLGNLGPVSDSYTQDADYTAIVPDGTTGGTRESNATVIGGYRIVTGTSDSVSTTNNTANSYSIMQGFCALKEVEYDDEFPTFPNLDRFNRANEDPLATPPWSNSTTDLPGQGTARLRVVSNQCARSSSGTFHGSQFWQDPIPSGDDGEVFATLGVVGHAGLHMFAAGSGQNSTLSGYATYWFPIAGNRRDNMLWGDSGNSGGMASAFMISWLDQVAGGKWGLQLRENGVLMHAWADDGTGWRWIGCAAITGGSYSNAGYFGINVQNDTTVRVDDFGGGTSIRFVPQIIRRPPDPDGAREPPP
jgi:hypothetical protein